MSAMTNVRRTWSLALLLLITTWQIADITAKYHHIKFRHAKHRRRHTEGYLPNSFVSDSNDPEEGPWGGWSTPSSCSRSCGGGIAYQARRCLDLDANGYDRCTGAKKRFFSCNIQPCPNLTDFRAEQCAEFNSVSFEGVLYDWIPYTGAPNKCELNCMPRGERFFYRHKPSVVDGTPCDVEKNDVCVEGKCMTVGCDMMLGSDAREDACRECGGDGSDCNTVNGFFETNDLQVGYIDILLIPEGATNIMIKEVAPSNNYLAIRNTSGHYYLNGNWRIDFPRSMKFANTIFHYSRDPQGFPAPDTINALGPTNEAIYVVLLYQDRNFGVQYEYSIPKKFSTQADPDSYTWTADEFSECSVSCGGGYQSRQVICMRRRDNEPVDDNLCDLQLEPDDTQSCNEEACPPEWVESEWTPCSKVCGEGGERTREIKCEQIIAGGIPTVVDDSVCIEKVGLKNETTQKCNENVDCPMWHLGPWKPCDHLCGKGKQTRKVTCYKKNESDKIEVLDDSVCEGQAPEREKPCELRPCAGLDWVVSEWSGCNKCGLSQETRTALCTTQDGSIYPEDKCDPEKKPELTRKCEDMKGCDYQWYSTQWSECSAKCGKGVQTRQVFCATFEDESTLKKVADEKCDIEKRYNDTKECTADIVECKGEWFAGPWSKCSKPCGGGDMTRKVICLQDNMAVATSNCDTDTAMFNTEECNKHPCTEDEIIPVEPSKTTVPTDEDEECEVYEDEDYVTFTSVLTSDEEESTKLTEEPSSLISSESTSFTITMSDETMMSDSAFSRGDISPDTGSGFGSGEGSGDDTLNILSSIYTDSSFSSSESSTFEGSGATTDEMMGVTTGSSDKTDFSISETVEETSTEMSGMTEKSSSPESSSSTSISDITSGATEFSESTEIDQTSSSTDQSIQTTSIESSSLSPMSSESSSSSSSPSISLSSSSSESSTIFDATSKSSESSTENTSESSTGLSDNISSSSSDLVAEDSSSSTSSDSATTLTDTTNSEVSTPSAVTESSQPTESENTDTTMTELTSETSSNESPTTDTTLTDTSMSTTESSSMSTADNTETSLETSSETTILGETTVKIPFTILAIDGESDTDELHNKLETSSESPTTGAFESTSSEISTSEVSDLATNLSTESSQTEDLSMSTVTESGGTSEFSTGSDETSGSASTEMSMSTESESTGESSTTIASSGSTELTSEGMTESATASETSTDLSKVTGTEDSTGSTEESTGSDAVTDTSMTSESQVTISETAVTTMSGETTNTEPTESTIETLTTESTVSGVTMTDEEDLTGTSDILDLFTTVSSAVSKEHKLRKCKIKKKKTCKDSEFGCCYDGISEAQGPFGKGCPTPETCAETKFGCCPDGVSVATGPNDDDCPSLHCEETLFGCCQDGKIPAEGNDFEGCKKPCNETEFGCCPDKETPASGKDNYGCCNVTEYGCCPDGIKVATGSEGEGCEEESTTKPYENECANSTYGCCPDDETPATGINLEGCEVINKENCSVSYFGCCPDNKTAALGSNKEGCHASCELSTYRCCPDKITPAHGPNGEGCCLSSQYKCCPDNLLPARGPDFYGCGCQYTRFRCCPDNTTVALGPNNEGCGCKYTTHGCCPNEYTPATGPNFKGCACYTYQFGCCPDGVTAAKGPRGHGCSCDNTEFGCCSDNRTPAKGPNFTGCTCDASKYGCCPDGIDEAQGENFEGCLTVPSPPGAGCLLAKERGSCRDFSVKWFFDTEYGGCSRFWYGGCDGNENRFRTPEECKDTCVSPKGRAACFLPKSKGPCEAYYPMWYYDSERKQCGQFIYSGCLGNDNKFETREKCEELCIIPDDINPCDLEKKEGICEGNFIRWYFNKASQTCEQFRYGGCKPNTNNFLTEIACHQQCLHPGNQRVIQDVCILKKDPGPCLGSVLRWYFDEKRGACTQFVYGGCKGNGNKFRTRVACERRCLIRDFCSLPRVEGNCTEKYARWYFGPSENRCMPFYYTGCGGNRNNFENREACENDCPPTIEQDICLLPAVLGKCHNYIQRWYYDSYEKRCRQFYYGGCEGNENNFGSEQECVSRCEISATTPPQEVPPPRFSLAMCFLPNEHGPCSNEQTKWFYDSRDGVCKQFSYGGCAGNGNKFDSLEECEYRCGSVQDACSMPKVIGPCSGSLIQFYYNRETDACEEFEYSQCGGNKNRFQDRDTCESKCRRRPAPPQPPTPAPLPPSEVVPSSPICTAPVDAGPCNRDITAYYYDSRTRVCQAFIYGGCEGNANRFQSEEQCERLCGRFQGQEVCNLPVDSGPCRGSFAKYFYDPNARACRQYYYGGCDGNANRFSTISECESVCLHREEPTPAGNGTVNSNFEICHEPVDVGSCPTGNYKRFYFDEERQTCMGFVYTGCGGNRNRFKTFESCMQSCFRSNQIVDNKNISSPCDDDRDKCDVIRCPYGKEAFVDERNCERCRCIDPCRNVNCPEGSRCSITLVAAENEGTDYRALCRTTTKQGQCPHVSNSTRCEKECVSDADCAEELKCCDNGCGTSCLEPALQEPLPTPPPAYNITGLPYGAVPATIQPPEDPHVSGEEGGYVNMKCIAIGYPKPTISWRKDAVVINLSEPRRRILDDGTLEIINLYSYDRGTYVCTADNGLAPPVKTEYQLEITEPHDRSAAIVGEQNTFTTVTMNSPTYLHCYAMGWPRPSVTWWHGERLLPLSSESYEQDSEYSLLIRSVTLTNLGAYTCQAYNGIDNPASWSVVLQAIGPVYNIKPEYREYAKYLVQPPKRPEIPTTDRPQYPYWPSGTQVPPYRQTYAPLYPSDNPYVPPVIALTESPSRPLPKRVPISVNVSTSDNKINVGAEFSIKCDVNGYPTPRVLWYRDDEVVRADGRVTISESNTLFVTNAGYNDTAKYSCEAYNEYSKDSDSVEVSVIGSNIDANCQDNTFFARCDLIVKAKFCQHKYYAKFCCRSCTEAGQLPGGYHFTQKVARRRRSIRNFF